LRSRIQYAFKHFNLPSLIIVLCVTLCLEPISRSILSLSKGRGISFKENLKAYGMLYNWLFNYKLGQKK